MTEEESVIIRSEEEKSGVYIVWRRGMEGRKGRRKGRRLTGKSIVSFFWSKFSIGIVYFWHRTKYKCI